MPNVTAIDCEQADVYGQSFAIRRHELHVQEARAAFFNVAAFLSLTRFTLAAQKILKQGLLAKQRGAPYVLADARDLNTVQVYRAKENRRCHKGNTSKNQSSLAIRS